MNAELLVLGAGQEVGRSCVVLCCNGFNIMFDCGLHMGKKGEDRLPLLNVLGDDINAQIQLLVVTHFHLDHVGAVPYVTEVLGYSGPVVMTTATKSVVPLILEDYHNICAARGDALYSQEQIDACMERVIGINIQEPFHMTGMTLCAYYAGHVIGAAMMHCMIGSASVLYTGDYNMVSDRLLGAAKVPRLRPDVLITESTYATTLRDPRRTREGKLLDSIHAVVKNGGKVLVPVFAVGSAQEMSMLIDSFWQRMHLEVPVYMSEGMATKTSALLTSLSEWGSQGFNNSNARRQQQDSTALSSRFALWRPEYATAPGPCVLFATPGMLQGGISLQVLKQWAPDSKNMVLLPGTSTAGTVGGMLLHAKKGKDGKVVKLDGNNELHVRCKADIYILRSKACMADFQPEERGKVEHNISFSSHTDAKGVVDLVSQVQPRAAVLVHGETEKMKFLIQHLQSSFNIPCYCPATGESVHIQHEPVLPLAVSQKCMARALHACGTAQVREIVQEICKATSSRSQVSASQVLQTALAEAVGGFGQEHDTEGELAAALASDAPSCIGQTLSVEGQLHGCQADNQRYLLLTLQAEDWQGVADELSIAHSSLQHERLHLQHSFTTPCAVEWSPSSGIGFVTVPNDAQGVCAGQIDVQVSTMSVDLPKPAAQGVDRQWMWDVLWADSLQTKPASL